MMVNLEIINFKKKHAHIMVNAIMNDPMTQIDKKFRENLNGLEVPGMSFTAMKDDDIICSGGVIPVWDHVFEGWVMGSLLIWENRIAAAKAIKKGMEKLIKDNDVKRLQTAVKKDFHLGHKFAKWLGLEEEGLMRKYQNNEDYIRFARIM
jgi:hypothetical protein|tara:strand:+ start:964 stop:1413 length:450 start_codon:yes stop_codon:yes gene_type:complete